VALWPPSLDGRLGPNLSLIGDRPDLRRASLHCLWRTIVVSREGDAGQQVATRIETGGADVAALDPSAALSDGVIADHIRDLALKARTQGRGRLDQTLLLRSLADRLRGSNGFGAFASDTVMKLGLLGTIIGFIIMLRRLRGSKRATSR
jgi:voltage-gated potassium channel Kch